MNLGCPDLAVATNERRSKGNRRGGDDSIRQIRNLYAAHRLESISDLTVQDR